MGIRATVGLGAALMLIGISTAHSDDAVTTSSADSESSAHFYDNYYLNYFGVYHGAPLNNLSSPYTVDQTGKPSHTAIYFDSEVTTAYMINSDVGVGPDIPFQAAPVLGQGFTIGDIGLKAFDKKTISTSNFTLYTNFYLQAPTAAYDANRGMWMGFKMTPYAMYHFSGTRWTIGTWSEEKLYAGAYQGKIFKLYALPYINYQITSRVSANLGYEMETDHLAGTSKFDFTAYETDFQPGFVWQITPKVLLNPYVQLFTGNRVGMDTTAVGAVVNAAVL